MKRFAIPLIGLALALWACDAGQEPGPVGAGGPAGEASEARDLVGEATDVLKRMTTDPELVELMQQAQGVFIVPEYGEGAAIVGGRGGEGVLLARTGTGWSSPAFYDIGAVSLGAQVGGTAGDIAMLLMSQQAIDTFKDQNNFSLNADAGFTLVDYSARAQASVGKGEDVVLWSDTEGAFAGVSLSVTDVAWDEEENRAYYDQATTPSQVLGGEVEAPQSAALRQELPS